MQIFACFMQIHVIYAKYSQVPAKAVNAIYMQVYAFICVVCKNYMQNAIHAFISLYLYYIHRPL